MRPSENPESAAPEAEVPGTAAPEADVQGASAADADMQDATAPQANLLGTTASEANLLATATPEAGVQGATTQSPDAVRVRRSLVGRVTSTKMLKTVTVLVERRVKHPLYGKYMVQSKKVHAHTENPLANGDVVEVQECRPISKTKTWMVVKVLDRAA
jgi:small subunit ribosomal protein S17